MGETDYLSAPGLQRSHTAAVNAVLQPDPGRLVSASSDHPLVLWDLETRQAPATFLGESAIRACAFCSASETVVVAEGSGHIHFLRIG